MNGRVKLLGIALLAGLTTAHGQFHLPSLDVQIKSGVAVIPDMADKYENRYSYIAPLISGEVNWNISQYFAVGLFASRGSANTKVIGPFSQGNTSYPTAHNMYGLKLRISSGRQVKFRPFAEICYGKYEMYMEHESYRISSSTNFSGGSMGLMIRLSHKWYIVLPQITLRIRKDPFLFEVDKGYAFNGNAPFIEITGGLSYNFGKKK